MFNHRKSEERERKEAEEEEKKRKDEERAVQLEDIDWTEFED